MRDDCSWHLCSSLHTYARRSCGSYLDDSEIFMTMHVGGLMFHSGQSNMQYVTTATFLLTIYAKYLSAARATVNCGGRTVTPSQLSSVARRQVNITSYISPTMIWERNYLFTTTKNHRYLQIWFHNLEISFSDGRMLVVSMSQFFYMSPVWTAGRLHSWKQSQRPVLYDWVRQEPHPSSPPRSFHAFHPCFPAEDSVSARVCLFLLRKP